MLLQPSSCVVSSRASGKCENAVDGNSSTALVTTDSEDQYLTLQLKNDEEANYNQSYHMIMKMKITEGKRAGKWIMLNY